MKFVFLIFILFMTVRGIAQDEIMLRGDTTVVNHELKIKRVSADTLHYRAFGKNRHFLIKDVFAYRYKDSAWTYIDQADKKKYIIRQGSRLLRHLQPDIILKRYELGDIHMERVKHLADHVAKIPVNGKKTSLRKNRPIVVSLHTDTTKTPLWMPLKKICSDSLFFIADFYNKKRLYGIPTKDIKHVLFDTDIERAVGTNMGLVGAIAVLTTYNGQVYKKIKFNDTLNPEDWHLLPIK